MAGSQRRSKEHWPIVMRWGPDAEQSPEEQWPYMFKIN
jgi:hypothetical protein